ncbi:MAG: hypothetical protein L0956_01325 [Candidatus Mariimomonas ferrooxydans]
MPACPASFFTIRDKQERFPTFILRSATENGSGNDTTCAIIYDAVYNWLIFYGSMLFRQGYSLSGTQD